MSQDGETTTITTAELLAKVREQHHSPEDLDEGDLNDRLWQFEAYEERLMPIDEFDLGEFAVHDDLVEEYAERIANGEVPPPIVWDPVNRSTIDGITRLNALARCEMTHVAVLVGIERTYTPICSM
jgi:hypothetical protein